MTRVRITGGFLNIGRRNRPGIDNELPGTEGPTDPDYGIDEGSGGAGIDNELPNPPPGVWPPLTPEQPWRPVDPGFGQGRPPHIGGGPARPGVGGGRPDNSLPGEGGEHPELPPGTIWPPLPPGVHGTYWALVLVKGASGAVQYRYVVIDADARPGNELPEEPPAPQPKKA